MKSAPISQRLSWSFLVKLAVLLLLAGGAILWATGLITLPFDRLNRDTIGQWVNRAELWGPVLIIGLMMIAIVASPIPSAPIALAAGAAYGHVQGTVYVIIGAELGALVAFFVARFLGRKPLERWLGHRVNAGLLGSQNALSVVVFASRLMPFVSFDMISYAAGLSALHFWRFAVATLAGIIPASFVLAHFGNQAAIGDATTAAWIAAGLGLATLTPLVVVALRERRRKAALKKHDADQGNTTFWKS